MAQKINGDDIVQICAPHFCAGLILDSNKRVVNAAPVIRWMIGKSINDIELYCSKKGWLLILANQKR